MIKDLGYLQNQVRIALDEIAGSSVDSDFMADLDSEIEQALLESATELSEELPDVYLLPDTLTECSDDGANNSFKPHYQMDGDGYILDGDGNKIIVFEEHPTNANGTGSLMLPLDFLRLVRLRLRSWEQDVREITDPNSNEARMQASKWTRGTPQKPKAVMGTSWKDEQGIVYRELKYYTAGTMQVHSDPEDDSSEMVTVYDHKVWRFSYLPMPYIRTEGNFRQLIAGLHDRAIQLVVYRACAILMEGKQNAGLADRFRAMSTRT